MRRTKLVLAASAVMVALLVAFAAPAMANDRHFDNNDFGFRGDVFFDENDANLEDACHPGLPDGIFISGCIFSDNVDDFNNGFNNDFNNDFNNGFNNNRGHDDIFTG